MENSKISRIAIDYGLKPLGRKWGYKMTFIRAPLAWRKYVTAWGEQRLIVITERSTI